MLLLSAIPPGWGYLLFLFIFLVGIAFLVFVSPFYVYFFVIVYFFAGLFPPPPPPPPPPNMASFQQIPISISLISLLKNGSWISPYLILRNSLHILRGQNLPPPPPAVIFRHFQWHHRVIVFADPIEQYPHRNFMTGID